MQNVVADLNFGLQTTTLQFRGNGATTLSNFVMRVQVRATMEKGSVC